MLPRLQQIADTAQALADTATAPLTDTVVAVAPAVVPTPDEAGSLVQVALILGLGIPLLAWITLWVRSVVSRRVGPHRGVITGKLLFYPGLVFLVALVMREMGFSLTPMLGAAGVVGIALGFASQTSVSNIVAGFFLVGERPFVVGDMIEVGTTAGRVRRSSSRSWSRRSAASSGS